MHNWSSIWLMPSQKWNIYEENDIKNYNKSGSSCVDELGEVLWRKSKIIADVDPIV